MPSRPPSRTRSTPARTLPRWVIPLAAVAVVVVLVVVLANRGGNRTTAVSSAGGTLEPGKPAPAVVLPATTGQTVDLSTYRGKRNVLLYFYEHAG